MNWCSRRVRGSNGNHMARRYQLSDEKTFESLFHPQKDGLLRLTDHFLQKTGCVPAAF